jgi:hypothetical protein
VLLLHFAINGVFINKTIGVLFSVVVPANNSFSLTMILLNHQIHVISFATP